MGEKITAQQGRKEPKEVQQAPAQAPAPKPAQVEKKEEKKMEEIKAETKVGESKIAEKKEEVKKPVQAAAKAKKEEAIARGASLPISKKHSMYIGYFIKGKTIDGAIQQLQEVIKFKRAIPFKGEIPHRSDPGMMSGRYPVSASGHFINMLKALKGNAIVNGLDIDKTRIASVSASWAHRPQKRGGARFKRTNVVMIAREITESKPKEKPEKPEAKEAKK